MQVLCVTCMRSNMTTETFPQKKNHQIIFVAKLKQIILMRSFKMKKKIILKEITRKICKSSVIHGIAHRKV